MGLFETDEAKEYEADIHRRITDGEFDGVCNGKPIRIDENGNILGQDKNGKWVPRPDCEDYEPAAVPQNRIKTARYKGMATKDHHIGNNMNVGYEFPCPNCSGDIAKGSFKKSEQGQNGHIDIRASCDNCEKCFEGTAVVHEAGLDVDVTFDIVEVKASDLKVWGF